MPFHYNLLLNTPFISIIYGEKKMRMHNKYPNTKFNENYTRFNVFTFIITRSHIHGGSKPLYDAV